jgi:hypothetical protein
MISFSMFSTTSKMKNRVKIIDFLTLLRITWKVIITEQGTATENLKDLVLSYEFTKK